MPRKNLIRTNLYPYHVYIRCNNKEWFDLPSKLVWEICLNSLSKANKIIPVKIQAFVLMSNHYHLMIWTPNADLDKFMFEFNKRLSHGIRYYTNRINRIFGDRYKWSLISNERYFYTVEKYIYQNPLHAMLVKKCEDYRFSTLHYSVNKLELPFELVNLFEITKDYLKDLNIKEKNRDEWTKSLLRPSFSPPKTSSSRRLI